MKLAVQPSAESKRPPLSCGNKFDMYPSRPVAEGGHIGWGARMATQTTVTLTCDICGGAKDTRTRSIALDGRALEIDLCTKDNRSLDKVAQMLVPYARKVARLPVARRTAGTRQRSADVRDWARTQGFEVSDRGRIPEEVERKYAAAH
jgi:hypothetical protein